MPPQGRAAVGSSADGGGGGPEPSGNSVAGAPGATDPVFKSMSTEDAGRLAGGQTQFGDAEVRGLDGDRRRRQVGYDDVGVPGRRHGDREGAGRAGHGGDPGERGPHQQQRRQAGSEPMIRCVHASPLNPR